jgi:REP element-mobilizing transposase RayT
MKQLPERKPNRLKSFDYSQNGAYFITICTKNSEHTLSHITVGTSIARPQEILLTETGRIVDKAIKEIPKRYEGVFVDNYVIMPNHIHMIIRIESYDGRPMVAPTISRIIQQMKGYATKQAGKPIWQNKAYDHIIRDDYDYMIRYQYIDDNPANWLLKRDEYN